MKMPTRTRYSIRIMIHLADHFKDAKPVSLRVIAQKQAISLRYLEQLIVPLKHAGLVRSVAGKHGGYYLMKKAALITMYEIVEAASGPLRVVHCVENRHCCELYEHCAARRMWEAINSTVVRMLKDFKLDDLATDKKKLKGAMKLDKWMKMRC